MANHSAVARQTTESVFEMRDLPFETGVGARSHDKTRDLLRCPINRSQKNSAISIQIAFVPQAPRQWSFHPRQSGCERTRAAGPHRTGYLSRATVGNAVGLKPAARPTGTARPSRLDALFHPQSSATLRLSRATEELMTLTELDGQLEREAARAARCKRFRTGKGRPEAHDKSMPLGASRPGRIHAPWVPPIVDQEPWS